jgi:hypothetical protein
VPLAKTLQQVIISSGGRLACSHRSLAPLAANLSGLDSWLYRSDECALLAYGQLADYIQASRLLTWCGGLLRCTQLISAHSSCRSTWTEAPCGIGMRLSLWIIGPFSYLCGCGAS